MGTPELAAVTLAALLRESLFKIVAVVTQPDRPKGRELKLTPSPVKEIALRSGLPVLQPQKARDEQFVVELKSFQPELIAVAAFGQILPKAVLDLPKHGCINLHTSLLPKYRGAAPIQWAIANGETVTGVTIMRMDVSMDTGDILTQCITSIRTEDNAATLHDRLTQLGAKLLVETIPNYVVGKIQPQPQDHAVATLAPKIQKEDGQIDWRLPAKVVWNRMRAFNPWPGAFTFLPGQPNPRLLKVWKAEPISAGENESGHLLCPDPDGLVVACGEGALKIFELQLEGGRRMTAREFLLGHALQPGQRLG
jgi:methionyl-tRNA formyltransferase